MDITRNIRAEIVEPRGNITRLLDDGTAFKSILLITSKAGTVRSNHYHKTDTHYCYILSGSCQWHEQPVAGGKVESAELAAGDMVRTSPMTVHAVKFLQDSVMLAFSTRGRQQEDYEADTVRVKLLEG